MTPAARETEPHQTGTTTVFYDGACPLCRSEIAHYRRRDTAGRLSLVDVSTRDPALPDGLDPPTARARFHVRDAQGRLRSGADAFVALWAQIPGWRMLARLARLPGAMPLLEFAYRGFLRLRPAIVRLHVRLAGRRSGAGRGGLRSLSALCLLGLLSMPQPGAAQMIDAFQDQPETRWTFISDQVMGGVSQGRVAFETTDGQTVLHLVGTVSTANRGGFIQARMALTTPPPPNARGIALRVRGNGQTYFIHARTSRTLLPWNFYQAPFDADRAWSTVRIPFSAFVARGRLLSRTLSPGSLTSIAIVAYGRDHSADVSVAQLSWY